jgi:ring-1,2-phenylacetyl-CoA epoxidase subunit PaaC
VTASQAITIAETPRMQALLARADDALVLGHRLSEWAGRAPMLEEELALANIALDLIGQARSLYGATGEDEDRLAYLRDPEQFRNALIAELPNGDFAFTMVRLLLVSAASDLYWRAAVGMADPDLAAIAGKAEKETAYHLRHAAEWLIRLGDGTAESHGRAQAALEALWPYCGELCEPDGFGPSIARAEWDAIVTPVIARATLRRPSDGWAQGGGRAGRHTEHLGHMLAVMQVLPRRYPGATW